jgi:NAD(P)-dependent dehydrogenase (short-subunit alcohol dehydrogenase family)
MSEVKNAFITGTSSGLGRGLAQALGERGWSVFGCSRRGCDLPGLHDAVVDLTDHAGVPAALDGLLGAAESLDLVVLNAGMLGRIRDLSDTRLDEAKGVMETNLWANKTVMDWLHAWGRPIAQIVMISSGAAVLGNRGWGSYALSKAALNMLARLYAHEFATSHVCALAPGIIDTAMMDYLCGPADAERFPALKRLRKARSSALMPGPAQAAQQLISVLPQLRERPSGSFIDIRKILDPPGYARLFGGNPTGGGSG